MVAGKGGGGVQFAVEIAAGQAVEAAGFEIHQHGLALRQGELADALGADGAAGVLPRAADEATRPSYAPVESSGAPESITAAVSLTMTALRPGAPSRRSSASRSAQTSRPFAAGKLHRLGHGYYAPVALLSDLRAVGKAEAYGLRLIEEGQQLFCGKGDEVLPGGRALRARAWRSAPCAR